MNLSQGNHKLRLKNVYERENPILKKRSMTVIARRIMISYGHHSDFF
jgi:hypothetical protein